MPAEPLVQPDASENPWPIDPTPGDMAYVAVCSDCHGMAFVCNTDDASPYIRQLMQCVRRGYALHRVPMTVIRNPEWYFCHGHTKKEKPHG